MRALTLVLVVTHAGVGALWLGSMAYSLFIVQPRLALITGDPASVENAQRELAARNRWPVVGLIAALWLTGAGLVAVAGPGADATWWAVVTGKAVLLAVATGLFWWVSWRGWPRRVFALPPELPGLQRRFRAVAVTMFVLVGAAFVAGLAIG
jgi:hypothetical protein